ncbi:MAG: hypothetical protein Q8P22_14235 [Chloroflexota bacterium]|nr:hypothetical protein [Chloroflexota bacterium]
MRIMDGGSADSFDEAVRLAFKEAGMADASTGIARLFASVVDSRELKVAAEDAIAAAVRRRYGRDVSWENRPWLVVAPSLQFDARGLPCITARCQSYVVAEAEIRTEQRGSGYPIALVGPLGKPLVLVLPLVFLDALLDDDLQRFRVVSRDGRETCWDVPAIKEPVKLPDTFVAELAGYLRRMPVVDWLWEFGAQGRRLAPLVAGVLMGLRLRQQRAGPTEAQPWTRESVSQALAGLGLNAGEIQQMWERAAPELRSDMTMEDAIRLLLRSQG